MENPKVMETDRPRTVKYIYIYTYRNDPGVVQRGSVESDGGDTNLIPSRDLWGEMCPLCRRLKTNVLNNTCVLLFSLFISENSETR